MTGYRTDIQRKGVAGMDEEMVLCAASAYERKFYLNPEFNSLPEEVKQELQIMVSMGEPDEVWEKRIKELSPYKVTKEVMANAKESAIFLHCLPAFHDLKTKIGAAMYEKFGVKDMEVTDEVFESAQSKVFDEAENRMHTIKAVMVATLGEF